MVQAPPFQLSPTKACFTPLSAEEVSTLGLDLREELLKRYLEGVKWRLAGPTPRPVFIPQGGPFCLVEGTHQGATPKNYRGLLILPLQRPASL